MVDNGGCGVGLKSRFERCFRSLCCAATWIELFRTRCRSATLFCCIATI